MSPRRLPPGRVAPPLALMLLLVLLGSPGSAAGAVTAAATISAPSAPAATAPAGADWRWPVSGPRTVVAPFRAPAHAYGPGHRGIDVAAAGPVRAPADGTIAFRGTVVDRPLLTIDHGDGLVTTYEPLQSDLDPGAAVAVGDAVGELAQGGHAPPGTLHVGVRWHGEYINPLLLFGEVPRAVLLPCGGVVC
ncbi:murein hydrolase activator EnvC family protein [Microbacterium resistens]